MKVKDSLLVEEWDLSNVFDLDEITTGSSRLVKWICSLGHCYEMQPKKRFGRGSGCPFCANKKVMVGFNDLATTHSELAKEWSDKTIF